MGCMYGLVMDVCGARPSARLADGCRRVCRGAIGGGSAPFAFLAHLVLVLQTLQCKQHGLEVPAMQMYPCPPPVRCRMSTGPLPNQMQIIWQRRRLYPSVGSGLILVRQRTCGLRRPTNDASADDPSGGGRPTKTFIWYLFASGPT